MNANELVRMEYLLKPLVLWVQNSLEYLTRLELFRSIWFVLIEVLLAVTPAAVTMNSSKGDISNNHPNRSPDDLVTITDIALPLL